jgi:hypothetical protein
VSHDSFATPNHAFLHTKVRILVTDDYVIQSLETIAHQEQQKSIITSIISPFVANPASQDSLIQTFNHMADVMETELQDLACSVILFPDKPLTHLQIESTVAATGILGQLQVNIKEIHHLVSKAQGKTEGDLERTVSSPPEAPINTSLILPSSQTYGQWSVETAPNLRDLLATILCFLKLATTTPPQQRK